MKNIRILRKRAGLTQPELAEKIGVSEITVRRWENTERNPGWQDIKKLCEVLGCTESELLNGPAKQEWKLEIVHDLKEAIEVRPDKPTAFLSVQPNGLSVTLAAGIDLWKDDNAFETIINQLREKRKIGLQDYEEGWA